MGFFKSQCQRRNAKKVKRKEDHQPGHAQESVKDQASYKVQAKAAQECCQLLYTLTA